MRKVIYFLLFFFIFLVIIGSILVWKDAKNDEWKVSQIKQEEYYRGFYDGREEGFEYGYNEGLVKGCLYIESQKQLEHGDCVSAIIRESLK